MHAFLVHELADWLTTVTPAGALARSVPSGRPDADTVWSMAVQAASLLGSSPEHVLRRFGRHLFPRLARRFPAFFVDAADALGFVTRLETHVIDEVRKLFPATPLPAVRVQRAPAAPAIELRYDGPAPLAPLAEGLVLGCVEYFDDALTVARILRDPDGSEAVRFVLGPRAPGV